MGSPRKARGISAGSLELFGRMERCNFLWIIAGHVYCWSAACIDGGNNANERTERVVASVRLIEDEN